MDKIHYRLDIFRGIIEAGNHRRSNDYGQFRKALAELLKIFQYPLIIDPGACGMLLGIQ